MGNIYVALGRKADAIKAYKKALDINTNYVEVINALRKLEEGIK
jgi:predicted negative regulator of RcsB-dependent stress response